MEGSKNQTCDGDAGSSNPEGEVGQGGGAAKDPSSVQGGVRGARHVGVVGLHDGGGQVEEGGSGVSNPDDGGGHEGVVADLVAGGGPLPVTGRLGNGRVGDGTGVQGAVEVPEVVGTGLLVLKIGSEDGGIELGQSAGPEGGLGLGGDGRI